MFLCVCESERDREGEKERERKRKRERECVCVIKNERERERGKRFLTFMLFAFVYQLFVLHTYFHRNFKILITIQTENAFEITFRQQNKKHWE